MKKLRTIDKVKASRDGHEYHEAWTARKALQLLLPTDNLVGIAVEGLQYAEQDTVSAETNDIADIVLYYGKNCTFDSSHKIKIVQFKYSVNSNGNELRASDAKKTITKFAIAYNDHIKKYGAKAVREKLEFELITNRPIYKPFFQAVKNIANGKSSTGIINQQAKQFRASSGVKGKMLVDFTRKCAFIGLTGDLHDIKKDLSRTLVDWSATSNDTMAAACLGNLRKMVRDKAGSAGIKNNVIRQVDILAELELKDVSDLLPCPPRFPEVGKVLKRRQIADAIRLIKKIDKPLLIHSAGGVGKTVFLQSLFKSLSQENEVLLFDCFGGGAYRAPDDARHLPKRGLVHIINTLAANSLCDPILPHSNDIESLIKKFRQRLSQCVNTLSTASKNRELIIFIDAIDNAYRQAADKNERSFPLLILESLNYGGRIPGVRFIFSCRTHRIKESTKNIPCYNFELKPFNLTETQKYLQDRMPDVTQIEIQVAQARSGGNPRILEHLVKSNRGLLDPSEINKVIKLDDLINTRVEDALNEAKARGYTKEELDTFLAGLTILPPPVPIEEYAKINEMEIGAVESFAADLAPLLEQTKYGLIFRDEPTETLIREHQGSEKKVLEHVAQNLLKQQGSSVYAARALPELLQMIGDGEQLFNLAFDERFPPSITSMVGRRHIRYARLKAAVLFAANKDDYNRLIHLLIELSTLTAVDQRGIDYILDAPDLVVTANDIDAMRRLFETRTAWPGTRHTRITIVNTLSNDLEEANRHAVIADEWIYHYRHQDKNMGIHEAKPEQLDIAAIPFCLIAQNRTKNALGFMRIWKDWYAYEVSESLFSLLSQLELKKSQTKNYVKKFLINTKNGIGIIAGALSFLELSTSERNQLVKKLSNACRGKKLELNEDVIGESRIGLRDGIMKSAAIATSLDLRKEANTICRKIAHGRPNIWSFRERFSIKYILPFLEKVAILSAIHNRVIKERDILPTELYGISSGIKKTKSSVEFKNKLKKRLENRVNSKQASLNENKQSISYELKQEAERFMDDQLDPLMILVKALSNVIGASSKKVDKAFLELLKTWEETRSRNDKYRSQEFKLFFQSLGCELVLFVLWTRTELNTESVKAFLKILHEHDISSVSILLKLIPILAKRQHLQILAGEQAIVAKSFIEKEDDVSIRASHYIKLARGILPASHDEASAYFKAGLEQMDAIGSGDFEFTNELLLFASSIKGKELDEQESHTLTNICELNMYKGEKFPWAAFAQGLAKVSGYKTLAKLSRWDDRSKITLDYTLLPYLTSLIQLNKIEPEYALALNLLANPAELYSCNTATFAKEIEQKNYKNQKVLINELIHQYEINNPQMQSSETLKTLAEILQRVLGKNSKTASYLSAAEMHYSKIIKEINEQNNYHGQRDYLLSPKRLSTEKRHQTRIRELVESINPIDEIAMGKALDELNQIQNIYTQKSDFFERLYLKVPYSNRSEYIKTIARLDNLDIYTKLQELKKCNIEWTTSSTSLSLTFKEISKIIMKVHAQDFIAFNQVSGYQLKEVSDITGIPISNLAVDLIKSFVFPVHNVSASIWLGIASIICNEADEGVGQIALTRLLKSNSAKLSSSVVDGAWKNGMYPSNDQLQIAAGLIWQMLGSYRAEDRWRAAHCVRCFAKFDKWEVIDALFDKYSTENSYPFQAPELSFYYLHARLWFLIALARISIDNPNNISKYYKLLLEIVSDDNSHHVLIKHFASLTLMNCIDCGNLKLSSEMIKRIQQINSSPYSRLKKKLKRGMFDSFYHSRPKNAPEIKYEFHLDYDFEKYDVNNLSDVFGKPSWEVKDIISEIVHSLDPRIKSMYETGGRDIDRQNRFGGLDSKIHSYGYYLGHHALLITAGKLLELYPITDEWYFHDNPWEEWLGRRLLTRGDGLWLSDGIDKIPFEFNINLLEKGIEKLVITGGKNKILSLVTSKIESEQVFNVKGYWKSPDKITVNIDSVLIKEKSATKLVRKLIETEPFSTWLPSDETFEDEYSSGHDVSYIPWIIQPSMEAKLDDNDPLGDISAQHRPKFSEEICKTLSLKTDDPFRRVWKNSSGEILAHALAWGGKREYGDESLSGSCLLCSEKLLKEILNKLDVNLIILVKLQRYEKEIRALGGSFSHTVAVIRINKNIDIGYYKGSINKTHQMKF